MGIITRKLTGEGLERNVLGLAEILADTVAEGGAVGFVQPLTREDARRWWESDVFPEVRLQRRLLFGAFEGDAAVGTVQLLLALPPNQPHRAEIAKMLVHPRVRRRGVGRVLLDAALTEAQEQGKTLVTLDTRTGDAAESLYAKMGFQTVGVIPDFAWDPDRRALHGTTIMYKPL